MIKAYMLTALLIIIGFIAYINGLNAIVIVPHDSGIQSLESALEPIELG